MEPVPITRFVSTEPVTVRPETPLDECARLAIRYRVPYLAVVDAGGSFRGLVADAELFAHDALGEAGVQEAVTAADVLMPPPLVVSADEPFSQVVDELAARRAEVAVVLVGGRLVGLLTEQDGVRVAAEQLDRTIVVGDVATRPVRTIPAAAPAYRAWTEMLEERIRHVVVVDGEARAVGILSLDELAATGGIHAGGPTAGQLCAGHLETASRLEPVRGAARQMVDRGIGCLPVLTPDGALSGIVTRTDILWALASQLEDEWSPSWSRAR